MPLFHSAAARFSARIEGNSSIRKPNRAKMFLVSVSVYDSL